MFCSRTPELRTGAAGAAAGTGAAGCTGALASWAQPAIRTTAATPQDSERTFMLKLSFATKKLRPQNGVESSGAAPVVVSPERKAVLHFPATVNTAMTRS